MCLRRPSWLGGRVRSTIVLTHPVPRHRRKTQKRLLLSGWAPCPRKRAGTVLLVVTATAHWTTTPVRRGPTRNPPSRLYGALYRIWHKQAVIRLGMCHKTDSFFLFGIFIIGTPAFPDGYVCEINTQNQDDQVDTIISHLLCNVCFYVFKISIHDL